MKEDRAKKLAEQALADLKSELDAGMSDTLLKFIECLSRFHRYSWTNCMLIAFQMTVTQCGTFQGLCFER